MRREREERKGGEREGREGGERGGEREERERR